MPDAILHALSDHGSWAYVIIFLAPFLESSAFLGLIVPGETAVVLAGFLAAQGYLRLSSCMAAVALGAILGDSTGYALGRFFGKGYFRTHDRFLLFKRSHLLKVEGYFARHGGKTVFWGRLVHLLRAMAPFAAGMSHMPYGRFALFNIAGGSLWAVTFTLLGYYFGQSWQLMEKWAGRAGVFVLFLVLVGAGFILLFRMLDRDREEILNWLQRIPSSPLVTRFRTRHPGLAAFVGQRLSPRAYLGLHLTAGMLLCAALVWLFGNITEDVITNDRIVAVDAWVNAQVLYFRSPLANAFMMAVTRLGGAFFVISVSLLAGAYLVFRKQAHRAVGLAAAILGGELLNAILKVMVHRPRPPVLTALIQAVGWSYPSGHAMMAATFYGMMAYLLVKRVSTWRMIALVVTLSCFMVFLIGFSRIYLQAHYLSDVLAGFTAGLFWLTVCVTGLEVYGIKKKVSPGVSPDA
jgi:membrane protein DedA with SNARE-associated domain/membrane-associated phospholipid phosphatase